jgi:hypothetical protein
MFDNFTLRQLLNEHGHNITLTKNSRSGYNVTTGSVTVTGTNYVVKGYPFDFQAEMVDGKSILHTDKRMALSTLLTNGGATPEPSINDEISHLGYTLTVLNVQKITSGGLTMCYLLHLRG